MKINVINRIDLNCLDAAIVKAGEFDYIVMNSQTRLEISCNSNVKAVTYQSGKDKSYCRYKRFLIAIDESMSDGEIKFVKEV